MTNPTFEPQHPMNSVGSGTADPLGATLRDGGANFSLFSYHAGEVELLLFDRPDDSQPSAVFHLDPDTTIQEHLYIILNSYWEALKFELPELPEGRGWARLVDTGQPSPEDISDPAELLPDGTHTYLTQSRSAVILVERNAALIVGAIVRP